MLDVIQLHLTVNYDICLTNVLDNTALVGTENNVICSVSGVIQVVHIQH